MAAPTNLKERLWLFVNSGLGIWFLSTAVVGIASWGYTSWRTATDKKLHVAEMVSKLDREISSRLLYTLLVSENYQGQGDGGAKPDLAKELLYPPGHEKMLIPEFADRNLRSLLYELSSLEPDNKVALAALDKAENLARQYEIAVRLNPNGGIADFKAGVTEICRPRWESVLQTSKVITETRKTFELKQPPAAAAGLPELDERRRKLIADMFSDIKQTRIDATTELIRQWASDPKVFDEALTKASQEKSNKSGVINTLVLFQSLDPKVLRPHTAELSDFFDLVQQNGKQTQDLITRLKTSLDPQRNPSTAE